MNQLPRLIKANQLSLSVVTLALLSFALYWQVLGFEYVWDDNLLFLDKTALLNDALSWRLLAEPVLPGTSYLRPLVFLTLYAEFHLFGQNPIISHCINILIYAANVLLVFYVCRRILILLNRSNQTLLSWIAAVIYAVHPSLVEPTAWVAGRFDLMATFFILTGVAIYICRATSPGFLRAFAVAVSMAGALLSKELGAVLPAVLVFIWIAIQPASRPWLGNAGRIRGVIVENRAVLGLLALIFLGYILLRRNAPGGIYHSKLSVEYLREFVWVGLIPLEALKFYAEKIFFPFGSINPLHPALELNPRSWTSLFMSLAMIAVLLFLGFQCLRRKSPAAWIFGAGLICLLPVLHFIPLSTGGNIGHERFLAAPLVFFCMSVVLIDYEKIAILGRLDKKFLNRCLLIVAVGWVFIGGLTTYTVQPIWTSDLSLWNWAYHKNPDFAFARYNYIYGALKAGRVDLVEKEIKFLQKRDGGLEVFDQVLYANLLMRKGDPESLLYLDGVMLALPKFHDMPDGRTRISEIAVPKLGIAGVYADYSLGLMMFKGDPNAALKYSYISEWYLGESEKIPLLYPRVATFLALGRDEDAKNLFNSLEPLFYSRKAQIKKEPVRILENYCRNFSGAKLPPCQKIVEKAKIMVQSFSGPQAQ